MESLYVQTTREAGAVHVTKRWGMHAAGRGSEAVGRARKGRVSRAMAGRIGRSVILFEREDRTSWFFLTLPNPGKGGKRLGDARYRRGSEAAGRAREGRASRAMAGRIGRSILLFEREIGPLRFFLHFPAL